MEDFICYQKHVSLMLKYHHFKYAAGEHRHTSTTSSGIQHQRNILSNPSVYKERFLNISVNYHNHSKLSLVLTLSSLGGKSKLKVL